MSTASITHQRGGGVIQIPSRSNPGTSHWVNVAHQTCSCKGFSYRGDCRHLRMVNAEPYTIVEVRETERTAYDVYDADGVWEGRLPSFADAYETITEDLGGVLGAPAIGGYYGGAV